MSLLIPPWLKFAAPALLALLLIVQTARLHSAHIERDGARAALLAQSERIKEVSAQAIEIATRATQTAEMANRRLNDATDTQAASTSIIYRDRVLRLPAANSSCPGTADLPATVGTQGTDGPRSDSVVLDREDALLCADNTARLQAAHDWAVEMIGASQP